MREDGTSIYYRYDAAGRLAREDDLDGSGQGLYAFDCRFDAAGDRRQLTKNGETTYYQYNTLNQLTLEGSTGGALTYYQWQADGALAGKQDARSTTYFTWDVDEALTQADWLGANLGSVQVAHQYDADIMAGMAIDQVTANPSASRHPTRSLRPKMMSRCLGLPCGDAQHDGRRRSARISSLSAASRSSCGSPVTSSRRCRVRQ
ncbi:hypothetical protein LLH23_11940, partial [bacterium]|nr:hypothetical protein [bacterium]